MKNYAAMIICVILCLFCVSCGNTVSDGVTDSIGADNIGTTSPSNDGNDGETAGAVTADTGTSTEGEQQIYPAETDDVTENTEILTEEVTTEAAVTSPEETNSEPPQTTGNSYIEQPPAGVYYPEALMYHLILEDVYSIYEALFVRPSEFEAHLTVLDELGYEYLFAEEWRVTEGPSVIITLDDGYEDNYTNMFPILKAHGAKATVFLVTDLIDTAGYLTSDQIKEMSASGLVSFQCHTAHHTDLSYQSAEGLRADFTESVSIIEGLTGKSVRALAYPAGSYNDTVLSVVPEFFDFAYTTKSPNVITDYTPYTVPRHYIARGYGRDAFLGFVRY